MNDLKAFAITAAAYLSLAAAKAWAVLCRAAKAFYKFWGPVADSIKSRVNADEWVRVIAKAGLVGGTTETGIKSLVTNPDVQAVIFIPLAAGLLAGLLEYMTRKQQGEKPS